MDGLLPPVRIAAAFLVGDTCAVCGRDWAPGRDPVPTAYTVESIEAGERPAPVCDFCIEEHDPPLFAALLSDRRRFFST